MAAVETTNIDIVEDKGAENPNSDEESFEEEETITGKYDEVKTMGIKSSVSLVINLKDTTLGGNIDEIVGEIFQGVDDVEVFKKGGRQHFSMRGLYLDLAMTRRKLITKLPTHLQDILNDPKDKRLYWNFNKIPTFDGVSHPVFQSNVKSGIRKRKVNFGIDDTSNDPYGKAHYKYNVLMNEEVDEKTKPTNTLNILMHGHPYRYRKEHLNKYSNFQIRNKDDGVLINDKGNKEQQSKEKYAKVLIPPDLEIGLMSMELGERAVICIPPANGNDKFNNDDDTNLYIDVSFNEIVFQETGCRLCGCTSETGEKVGISKKRGERVAFVFMRNLCCGTPYTCVACPLCIRMVGFIISILSVFQIFIMEMCN